MRIARTSGRDRAPVIKWLANPAEAIDYLARMDLDELLGMSPATFGQVPGSQRPFDQADERASEVHSLCADILQVEENDRVLMAPKLAAKSMAMTSGAFPQELFKVRAKLAQIGWLETSWAATGVRPRPLFGEDRKWVAPGLYVAFDPYRTYEEM